MSHECNDYIVKNGQFLRNFEDMYKHVSDPWDQEKNYRNEYGPNLAIEALRIVMRKHQIKANRILDVGCASGYHAEYLLGLPCNEYLGTDVSQEIVSKAAKGFTDPRIEFKAEDIRVANPMHAGKFDIVFSAGTLYYVAPEIDAVIENIISYLTPAGVLAYVYNSSPQSFTNQWLDAERLRQKLTKTFAERVHFKIDLEGNESVSVGVFQRLNP